MKRPAATFLLVASVLLHWPLGVTDFTFDDRDFVQENASIRSLSSAWGALLAPFPPDQPERGLYRPLTNLSYAFDFSLSGDDARGFHRTNVALYLAVVLLVHRLALAYLASPTLAFAVALVFSLHPVHTGAVDAVAGRSELLALLFGLSSILLFLRAVRSTSAPGWMLAGSLAAYALACFSKETGAVLPGVLAFHVAFFHPPRTNTDRLQRNRAVRFIIPFALVLAGYLAIRYLALGRFSPEQLVLSGQPFEVRLFTMGAVFFDYMRLLIFPRVLQVDFYYHDRIGIPTEPTAAVLLGAVALAALLALLATLVIRQLREAPVGEAVERRGGGREGGKEGERKSGRKNQEADAPPRRAVTIVALATFLIFLFPVSHALDIGALLAERFLLAPSLGFVLLAVLAADELLRRSVADPQRRKIVALLLLGTISVLGGWRSATRAAEWRDTVRLWRVTASAIPWDARAQLNLGGAYFDRGELDAARSAFERALAIEPRSRDALSNLGAIQLKAGDYAAALTSYQSLLEVEPRDFSAWNNLGLAEAYLERHTVAKRHYERALQLNPNFAPARDNLRESQRLIAKATLFLEQQRAAAANSQDPVLLQTLSGACTVIADSACAEHFAARAVQAAQEAPAAGQEPAAE